MLILAWIVVIFVCLIPLVFFSTPAGKNALWVLEALFGITLFCLGWLGVAWAFTTVINSIFHIG